MDLELTLLEDAKPCSAPLYALSQSEMEALRKHIEGQVEQGLLRPSSSEWGAPVTFAKKRDGGLRICYDYRKLNAQLKRDAYPVPLTSDLLDRLANAKIFTKLDLRAAYNQVCVREGDEHLLAIKTRFGLFEPLVMPFGIVNGTTVMQRNVNETFRDYVNRFLQAFFDDILVYLCCRNTIIDST